MSDKPAVPESTLLPCPFCGKPAVTVPLDPECADTKWQVECAASLCPAQTYVEGDTIEAAIAAWNTRPAASPVAGVSARIAEIEARLAAYPRGAVTRSLEESQRRNQFIAAAPDDIRYLLGLVKENCNG